MTKSALFVFAFSFFASGCGGDANCEVTGTYALEVTAVPGNGTCELTDIEPLRFDLSDRDTDLEIVILEEGQTQAVGVANGCQLSLEVAQRNLDFGEDAKGDITITANLDIADFDSVTGTGDVHISWTDSDGSYECDQNLLFEGSAK